MSHDGQARARWAEFQAAAPEFAGRVAAILRARKHHTLATLRTDGSPRVSGIEVQFNDGELTVGMMPDSLKLRDVLRDPRVALHAQSVDPPEGNASAGIGDVKLSGRLIGRGALGPGQPPGTAFALQIEEVALTRVDDPPENLVIEGWHPGRGYEVRRRA